MSVILIFARVGSVVSGPAVGQGISFELKADLIFMGLRLRGGAAVPVPEYGRDLVHIRASGRSNRGTSFQTNHLGPRLPLQVWLF